MIFDNFDLLINMTIEQLFSLHLKIKFFILINFLNLHHKK